jgi:hypothetical protein
VLSNDSGEAYTAVARAPTLVGFRVISFAGIV